MTSQLGSGSSLEGQHGVHEPVFATRSGLDLVLEASQAFKSRVSFGVSFQVVRLKLLRLHAPLPCGHGQG